MAGVYRTIWAKVRARVPVDSKSETHHLRAVKTWLDGNPNDVVTLLIVNSDDLPPSQYDSVFQAADLVNISYAPPQATVPISQWPTMGSLIDSGKRLITFMDAEADFTSVPYIIDGMRCENDRRRVNLLTALRRIHKRMGDGVRCDRPYVRLQCEPDEGRHVDGDVPHQPFPG